MAKNSYSIAMPTAASYAMGAMRFWEVLKPRTEIGYFRMRRRSPPQASQRNKPGFIENMAM
ncbi:hypothetical protein [Nostoc sp.]|uniref:hypothetical protein n=1 Tax=Nostoc sp. TaxID=1180 RepID=UPI002FFAE77E